MNPSLHLGVQLNFDSAEPVPELKTPILVSLFRILGAVELLGTALGLVVALKTGQSLYNIPAATIVACTGVFFVLVQFGIAELILLIAKIEYNTAAQKDAAILKSLHRIEGDVRAWREARTREASTAAQAVAGSSEPQFDAAQVVAAMEATRRAARSSASD